jgi:hypothetical protein
MANPLKAKLQDRFQALTKQRAEKAAAFAAQLALIDAQIDALRSLAQNWDTFTVDQALAALDQTGITLDLKS